MTDVPIVTSLIKSCTAPIFVVSPQKYMTNEEMTKLFIALESVLEVITSKMGVDFDIVITSAADFDGYDAVHALSQEQKNEAEAELWK